ncbi:hypothetical protein LTR62_001988 [Meristemomyces frigidus]|uniref:RSC complex subunit Rsc7 n=1 Tax=Meristemomyces frigidus TaxID=1508187 RepID=A0AAN7TG90_9PEZI|nr:hypothetical protein LTR62_001988 [Meristemomyces frigidus]
MDESGTINPAALNAAVEGWAQVRKILVRYDYAHSTKPNKRSKAIKTESMALALPQQGMHTPQLDTKSLPQMSPQRSTPGSATKSSVVKALPTVRDHTTDQLGPEGDEYMPRESDASGETKVSKDGYPLDGRKYRCRTFQVPNRGEKLFMLATECARVLGYRDSYLLFNKNRSLFKIIANQPEKDNLIHQEILPYSYRSRQIAIVTARSMFRQFGSRLIEGGRRVRDDYWEAKARKQGFTEDDPAGEKRPGAAKQREAAAAEASHKAMTLPQGEIIYSNGPGMDAQMPGMHPVSLAPAAPLPMIHLASDDLRPGGTYGNIVRPRQDITGPPYQDRTMSSSSNEILAQATQAAEYNKQLAQTRIHRSKYLDDYWNRHHEQPVTQMEPTPGETTSVAPQQLQSPQAVAGMSQPRLADYASHSSAPMLPQHQTHQNQMASPVQQMHRQMPPSQLHQGSPSMSMGGASGHRQTPSYGYSTGQMWQQPQPQPSPISQAHSLQQYSQQQHGAPMPPPQLPGQGLNYGQMSQMGGAGAYGAMNRGLYQPSPTPQQYNLGPMSTSGQQPNMQGWTTPNSMGQQDWSRYQ